MLEQVKDFILGEMSAELVRQGHRVTGDLIESLFRESRIIQQGDQEVLEGRFLHYGVQMDIGRRPGKMVPISALVDWIRRKGIYTGNRDLISLAWAISVTIMREGVPTRGSRAQGKRLGWMTDTLNDNEEKIGDMILASTGLEIDNAILQMIQAA